MNSPSAMLKLTSVRARKPPNSLLTPLSCRNAPLAVPASAVMTAALSRIGLGRAPGMLTRNSGVAEQMKYVAIVVTIAPIVAIYPFLQRYFIKGVMIGALKG